MHPKDADGMANSVDPDQTAPSGGAVWSGSTCLPWSVCPETYVHYNMSRLTTKPTKWSVHPAKTPISLGIRPIWSESKLSAWRKLGSLDTYWVDSEDSDQTGQMPRLIRVLAGCTGHFVGFVMRRLNLSFYLSQHSWLELCKHSKMSQHTTKPTKWPVHPVKTHMWHQPGHLSSDQSLRCVLSG